MHLAFAPQDPQLPSRTEGGQAEGPPDRQGGSAPAPDGAFADWATTLADVAPALDDTAPLAIGIGFLAVRGWPLAELRRVAAIAAALGVSADEVMIKHGFISEEAFYSALAGELGAPFIRDPVVSPLADFPDSILSGLAPLASGDGRFLRAPAGEDLVRLLASRRTFGRALAVTTPSALRRAVFRAHSGRIANRAANELPDRAALLSYRGQITALQIVVASLVAAALAAAATRSWTMTTSVLTLGLAPVFLGMVVLRLAAAAETVISPPTAPYPRLRDAALTVYTVIVALHREGRVIGQLVDALCRLDYPPAKLDIKLVIETGAQETAEAVACLDLPAHV